MGSCDDDWPIAPKAQSELGFDKSASDFAPFTPLSEGNGEKSGADSEGNFDFDAKIQYPIRPFSDDCSFYVRTGVCKFGLSCRFNHPVRREDQGVNEKEKEKEKEKVREIDGFRDQTGQIECKYYLTAGGCKYGKDCRYNHSQEPIEVAPVELNFLGLPVRLGVRECLYYMHNGSCGYGANCRFHHPEPTEIGGSNPTTSGESGDVNSSGEQYNDTPDISRSLGASQSPVSSWSPYTISNSTASCLGNNLYNLPGILPKEGVNLEERYNYAYSAPEVNNMVKNADDFNYFQRQIDVEEFPERPGQPDCNFFMRTGDCKFRSACRYHHPKSQISTYDAVIYKGMKSVYPQERIRHANSALAVASSTNNADLSFYYQQQTQVEDSPERPGRPECDYFMRTGSCKYGSACRYHHPKREASKLGVCTRSDKDLPSKPVYLQGKAKEMIAVAGNHLLKSEDVPTNHQQQIQVEEFPERPGHPECDRFVKTGDCKYRSACRYHHPKNQESTLSECTLNDNGLPIRPDRKICWHYEHYGICKYGSSCLFNHPENHDSTASLGDSVSEPLSSSSSGTVGGTKMDGCKDGS